MSLQATLKSRLGAGLQERVAYGLRGAAFALTLRCTLDPGSLQIHGSACGRGGVLSLQKAAAKLRQLPGGFLKFLLPLDCRSLYPTLSLEAPLLGIPRAAREVAGNC